MIIFLVLFVCFFLYFTECAIRISAAQIIMQIGDPTYKHLMYFCTCIALREQSNLTWPTSLLSTHVSKWCCQAYKPGMFLCNFCHMRSIDRFYNRIQCIFSSTIFFHSQTGKTACHKLAIGCQRSPSDAHEHSYRNQYHVKIKWWYKLVISRLHVCKCLILCYLRID